MGGFASTRRKFVFFLALGLLILCLVAGAWFLPSGELTQSSASMARGEEWMRVNPQAKTLQLDIEGTISAGKSLVIAGPFDGVIQESLVRMGDQVDTGDVLLVMDTTEIMRSYRDAQSAFLKASMAVDVLKNWGVSPKVMRAKRALETTEASLASLEQQVVELKRLLDLGIIPRNEYEGIVDRRNSERDAVKGAREELEVIMAQGDEEGRFLAQLELDNAEATLQDLDRQLANTTVTAEFSGIVVRPPVEEDARLPVSLDAGTHVHKGTALFSIADTSRFVVTGTVDEIDVNRVRPGQRVIITSDVFPGREISGEIISVSAEASLNQNGARMPSFEVVSVFSVDDENLHKAIRIGMSARMTIETYTNPETIIILPSAVIETVDGYQARIRRDGQIMMVDIELGNSFPSGVEVLSGLRRGDEVQLSQINHENTPMP
ncbi:hypothetical protein TALK_08240 [Thalassospira alkalitolerans]|uniref:YknX-like beta-barrel domain-containing protein n=1 Tax=Thalassospira alkalitolerans TaxID=1293890 RepID=A0A1Y2LC93_9PROT|nr:hypothetical protein TALK_08240 [Thalassospira alkalitolerans]